MVEPALLPDSDDCNSHDNLLLEGDSSLLNTNNSKDGSSLDYDDFPLDIEEVKDGSFDANQDSPKNNDAWVQLLNLPPTNGQHPVPVGGMRRVSSCYFSIASNLSSGDGPSSSDHNPYSSFATPNPSYHSSYYSRHHSHHYDALSFEGRNASDFLLHDVLMNVFSFLDARSLASFSETARRPNFECFYFLELQLQRALLMGEGHNHFREEENDYVDNLLPEEEVEEEESATGEDETVAERQDADEDDNDRTNRHDVIPSFEGSIAGTGVISRLASLDNAKARKIVQTYLDSNASISAMPLSHSLAYFRQVLRRGGGQPPFPMRRRPASFSSQHPPLPNIPENMAKNARNMALFFTLLGAAYMHTQQGGDVPPITMPDPSEMLNEENMEALKGMMLKVGLAGGFFKAGKTMKEKAEMKQNHPPARSAVDSNDAAHLENDEGHRLESVREGSQDRAVANAEVNVNDRAANDSSAAVTNGSPFIQARPSQRSSSIGSLEDLSHIMHPSAIASRLYNAFSNNNGGTMLAAAGSSPNTSTANLDSNDELEDHRQQEEGVPSQDKNNANLLPKKQHRGKRSHKILRSQSNVAGGDVDNDNNNANATHWEETNLSEPTDSAAADAEELQDVTINSDAAEIYEEHKMEDISPEEIAYAMDHPFSPNPYDHPLSASLSPMAMDEKIPSNDAAAAASTFFSFNMTHQESTGSQSLYDDGNVPTGCVGAYAHAVKSAASELTRLIKYERKSNFDALPPGERLQRGIRFIDACTSDNKLHIVKLLLPCMDVDRFFIGPDDTETCALHAAAFNGAESVLRFLCGGIDEKDASADGGLCDVNVRDGNWWTALHFAAGANSVTSVRVLAGHGAKLTIEASNGYTPYHWAERLSNEEVAAELERLGADNRFVGRWVFGSGGGAGDDRKIPFVSFLANRFFGS